VPGLADAYGRDFDVPVWNALVRTAMSATQRGQGFDQWLPLVTESRSHLGQQARRMGGRKDRSDREWRAHLGKAWDKALSVVAARPTIDAEHIAGLIAAVRATVSDADADLTDDERAVLSAVAALAEHHETTRPACPRREVQKLAELSDPRTRAALSPLVDRGVLAVARRGRAGSEGKRRATLYWLPSREGLAALSGPKTHTPPQYKTYGFPHKTYGFPPAPEPTEQETDVAPTVNMTITGAPEAVAALVSALRGDSAVAVQTDPRPSAPPQLSVVPGEQTSTRPPRRRPA
jgi:hypothetical protein